MEFNEKLIRKIKAVASILLVIASFVLLLQIYLKGKSKAEVSEKFIVHSESEKQDDLVGSVETDDSSVYILVDVSGAVTNPGVYELKKNSRLEDAIKLAGGYSEIVDMDYADKNINLSRVISDGEKIYIPKIGESVSTTSEPLDNDQGTNGLININTASQSVLESLPGIGPSLSDRIINARPYRSISDINKVSGIGDSKFEAIKDLIKV